LRRTPLVGTVALVASLLWLSPEATVGAWTSGGASQGQPAGATATGEAAETSPADDAGPPEDAVDPVAVADAVERQAGDRYGGYWVEPQDDDEVVHVNVVEPTQADHRAAAEAAAGGTDRVRVHEVAHSYGDLVAARDAVASSLDREQTGDFAVGVGVPENGLAVETERGHVDATRLVSLAAIRQRALGPGDAEVAPASEASETSEANGAGQAGGPGGVTATTDALDQVDDIDVVTGSDIGVEPLGETPTTFPPYEAGLHLLIPSGGTTTRCTSAFSFSNGGGIYGSTAGHCARRGESVRAGATVIDTVAINPSEGATRVEADVALYSLSSRGWAHEPVMHGPSGHRRVTGSLSDGQIGNGLRLCFDGRKSGVGNCGAVNATGEVICCDGANRSFVFTCLDHAAQSGDSGGPVYRSVGTGTARAAGILSSSVTVGGRRSMCFSTVDQVQRATGTRLSTHAGP
jgi:hypothetical protein